jgi:hypothetical protein
VQRAGVPPTQLIVLRRLIGEISPQQHFALLVQEPLRLDPPERYPSGVHC